jgi:hypothetical protein
MRNGDEFFYSGDVLKSLLAESYFIFARRNTEIANTNNIITYAIKSVEFKTILMDYCVRRNSLKGN